MCARAVLKIIGVPSPGALSRPILLLTLRDEFKFGFVRKLFNWSFESSVSVQHSAAMIPHVRQESPAGPTQCDATAKAPHNDFKEDSELASQQLSVLSFLLGRDPDRLWIGVRCAVAASSN